MRYTLALLLFVFGCNEDPNLQTLILTKSSGGSSPELQVEIVRDEETRQMGLMYRKELAPDRGMLFIFPDESPRAFWMKNTFISLDMIFIDTKGTVVALVKSATPLTETRRESVVPARYVLEVPGGSSERWGIEIGSKLRVLKGDLADQLH